MTFLLRFFVREWLLTISIISLILTSILIKKFPAYSVQDLEVLVLLFFMFVSTKGIYSSGFFEKVLIFVKKGEKVCLQLVFLTFVLAMFLTNDIALLIIIPITLELELEHKEIAIILETISANAGSSLTPFGNPQNLFIYWYYKLHPLVFIKEIAPLSLLFLVFLVVFASFFKTSLSSKRKDQGIKKNQNILKPLFYILSLLLVLLCIFRILPLKIVLLTLLYPLLFDRQSLKVDYFLLLIFFFFFGVGENLKTLFASEIRNFHDAFLFSALISQLMSNVPATLLVAKFTSNWPSLLWGSNVGGFGSLFGSFANLIAYRLCISHNQIKNRLNFTIKFLLGGYVAFFVGIGFYLFVHSPID